MKRLKLEYEKEVIEYAFGLGFLGEFIDQSGIALLDLQTKLEENPYKTIPLLMFYSRKWAVESQGKELDFTLGDTIELIDDNGGITSKNSVAFLSEFAKSMTKDVPKEKPKKGEKPKN